MPLFHTFVSVNFRLRNRTHLGPRALTDIVEMLAGLPGDSHPRRLHALIWAAAGAAAAPLSSRTSAAAAPAGPRRPPASGGRQGYPHTPLGRSFSGPGALIEPASLLSPSAHKGPAASPEPCTNLGTALDSTVSIACSRVGAVSEEA